MKLAASFLQLPLLFDAEHLASEIDALGEVSWRPHPNGLPGNSALTLITTEGNPDSDKVRGPMRPTPYLEQCPYLMQILGNIGGTWGRTRLMRLSGQAEVLAHIDVNYYWRERVRVHVPIRTQPTVRFTCGDDEIHMAAGECWIFDTWRMHRVINDASLPRIHLVADTVGGELFWDHVGNGRVWDANHAGWLPTRIEPNSAEMALDFESVNQPIVMTPWEIREHIAFALNEAEPHPDLVIVRQTLINFMRNWHALWSCYGESEQGWPRYHALLKKTGATLVAQSEGMRLRNGVLLINAIAASVLAIALADRLPAEVKA